jgi:hypothetical protein
MSAFRADDPGSNPGGRKFLFASNQDLMPVRKLVFGCGSNPGGRKFFFQKICWASRKSPIFEWPQISICSW